jgi:DNA-binding MarR family transcriptional regulator
MLPFAQIIFSRLRCGLKPVPLADIAEGLAGVYRPGGRMARNHEYGHSAPKLEISLTEEEANLARRLLLRLLREDLNSGSVTTLHEIAGRIWESRQERRNFFPNDLFAEPAWDIVLLLYCAEGRGERLSVTALAHSVGLAQTTALRWIGQLTDAGLVERLPDDHDRRRNFVKLTGPASEKVASWLISAGSRLGSPLGATPK